MNATGYTSEARARAHAKRDALLARIDQTLDNYVKSDLGSVPQANEASEETS